MFNLFKKSENKDEPKEVRATNYPAIVEQIHTEFHSAAEVLLAEAKQVIAEASTKDAGKVSRLEKLGFKQAQQVTELKPLLQRAELSREQMGLVGYYSSRYPNNKFITEDQVKAICFKYNLVCGEVSRYKGFVPVKNLIQIEQFRLKDGDGLKVYSVGIYQEWAGRVEDDGGAAAEKWRFIYEKRKMAEPMQICAPVKDMDLSGMTIEDGYRVQKIHVPDPVVLQPVKGGYLILTAWGDEASDENVVNQKFN